MRLSIVSTDLYSLRRLPKSNHRSFDFVRRASGNDCAPHFAQDDSGKG